MRADLGLLETAIGYRFADPEILDRALTHSSHARGGDPSAEPSCYNEQLEFLGDAVLGFLVSEQLFTRFPQYPEGRLSRIKAGLVNAGFLHEVARELSLGEYLRLGLGEERTGGRHKKSLLADALEALIAAVYLDGGIEPARAFVASHILERAVPSLEQAGEAADEPLDYRNILQDLARARHLPEPRYNIARVDGPAHARTFTVEVRVGDMYRGQAEASKKKRAAQRAAQAVYESILRSPA
jgi:ribonuclease-3